MGQQAFALAHIHTYPFVTLVHIQVDGQHAHEILKIPGYLLRSSACKKSKVIEGYKWI